MKVRRVRFSRQSSKCTRGLLMSYRLDAGRFICITTTALEKRGPRAGRLNEVKSRLGLNREIRDGHFAVPDFVEIDRAAGDGGAGAKEEVDLGGGSTGREVAGVDAEIVFLANAGVNAADGIVLAIAAGDDVEREVVGRVL